MRKSITLIGMLTFLILFSACKKEDSTNPEEEDLFGYLTYYGLIVGSNPGIYSKAETQTVITNYRAELKDEGGVEQLEIYWGDQYSNVTVTVDFMGVGNYSSDSTNLFVSSSSYDGLLNPTFTTDDYIQGAGAYMEILTHSNGTISGNLRYMVARYDSQSGQNQYGGIDDCLFHIQLDE
jgi:hypothetical protein